MLAGTQPRGGHQVRWAAARPQQARHQHGVEPAQPRPIEQPGAGVVRLGMNFLVYVMSTVPIQRGMGPQYEAAGCKVGCCIPTILGTTPWLSALY